MSHDPTTTTRTIRRPGVARAEKRRHERQDTTDSYIDRHGTVELPIESIAALMR